MTRSEATKLPVAIIGAGSSGITTGKALGQRGLPFEILEKGSQLGGMWRYENDSGTSSAYRSLHIDTSSKALAYPDFPVPAGPPDYLSHRQVVAYLEAYARHFGVTDRIRFGHVVDFIQWHAAGYYWPAFNLADSAITLGAALLIWDQLRTKPASD